VPDDNVFKIFGIDNKILNVYADEFRSVRPSVYEVVFDHNWYSRVGIKEEAKLKEEYEIKRGDDWPTWDKFIVQDFSGIPKDIKDEINNQHEFTNRYLCRYDTHPTPAEYLEYITRVAPDIEVSTATQDWVTTVTDRLIKHQDLTKLWKPNKKPARF
jgi:hypothetical protein